MSDEFEKVALALDRLGQSLRESAFQVDRTNRELLDLSLVREQMALEAERIEQARQAWERDAVEKKPDPIELTFTPSAPKVESAQKRPEYPRNVGQVSIDWNRLRIVAVSRLANLVRDGAYNARVSTDKGYVWLAEQLGTSRSIRLWMVGDTEELTAELFIRLCLWLGYAPSDFIDNMEES